MLPVAFRGWQVFASTNAPESSPTAGALACSEVVSVDRCDRCADPARVRWSPLATDLDERALTLCAHHSADNAEALVEAGWVLVAEMEVAG